jgi:hypothetical protein
MLFHFTNTHTPENCAAHDPERLKKFVAVMKSAEEHGVHIHSMYAAPWEHTVYGVVEAESAGSLGRWADPLLGLTTSKFTPVTDALAAIEERLERSQ